MAQIQFDKITSAPDPNLSTYAGKLLFHQISSTLYDIYIGKINGYAAKIKDHRYETVTVSHSFAYPTAGNRAYVFRVPYDGAVTRVSYAMRATAASTIDFTVYSEDAPGGTPVDIHQEAGITRNTDGGITAFNGVPTVLAGDLIYVLVTDITGEPLELFVQIELRYS